MFNIRSFRRRELQHPDESCHGAVHIIQANFDASERFADYGEVLSS